MTSRFRPRKVAVGVAVLTLAGASLAAAQDAPRNYAAVQITPEQAQLTAGDEMYQAFCASCHGVDAKGSGPAARALMTTPPDLTLLSANNGGKFPRVRTLNAILGDRDLTAHGTREMPIWGDIFTETTGSPAMARFRAYALVKHLESLQTEGAEHAEEH